MSGKCQFFIQFFYIIHLCYFVSNVEEQIQMINGSHLKVRIDFVFMYPKIIIVLKILLRVELY
jgi:hypothetical protein